MFLILDNYIKAMNEISSIREVVVNEDDSIIITDKRGEEIIFNGLTIDSILDQIQNYNKYKKRNLGEKYEE